MGVAEYLVNTVKFDSIKKGFKQIFLDVSLKNLRAYRFYEKHGFVFNGEEKPLASHPEIMVQTMELQSKK
ncbi:GNAT family N-acetyltransferase [Legionella sp. km535]|uniref:GNAT family N-acetyltransferase n=1 Tax=Legionella sp. km535 TaxID=2498107 RepID=UPI000F8C5ED1|nr:GNAT family N-acetyltransferase [Legionella sp. km535]